ncbi:hypothetical protein P12x_000402 [Tundrisphaera lichenicola]|uniref:hypothetical protein n=1 Tax=Tundrisphaera lichenicola TaxID=2029860 RepID=UPI003EB9FA21
MSTFDRSSSRITPLTLLGFAWVLGAAGFLDAAEAGCPRCGWAPPKRAVSATLKPGQDLWKALQRARPGTTVLLEDGTYTLQGALQIVAPGLVVRGKSGDRSKVILRGASMVETAVLVAVSIEAPNVTLADLTIGRVGYHGVQVHGELGGSGSVLHNVRIVDTGQQLVKATVGKDGRSVDDGLVACSSFEYSDHAPSDYTNGVDVHRGKGWVVRDSIFLRIRGPRDVGSRAGPAILFWNESRGTIVERNRLIDCYRGIALGLIERGTGFDHQGGVIRNNVLVNLNSWADEAIEASNSGDVRIEHNTVFVEGQVPWSIGLRFPATNGVAFNNLSNRPILLRNGARAELKANVTDAGRDWFVDLARGDLRLARGGLSAIDAGVLLPEIGQDFDRHPRVVGKAPDAGAFEFTPKAAAPQPRR